jgi:hypothetical protein
MLSLLADLLGSLYSGSSSGDVFRGQGGKIERHDDGIDER